MLSNRRAGLLLGVLVGLVFARGIAFGFIWDDHRIIEDSPRIRELSSAYEVFVRPSTWVIGDGADSPVVTYRPTAMATVIVDQVIWGGDPRGFHFTNVLLHVACALLFWQLLLRLGVAADASFALALVFGIHPVGAEAVTWISGRSETLCLLFGLWALVLCARAGPLSVGSLAGIAATLCLSLLGKETGIIFVVLCVALVAHQGLTPRALRGAAAVVAGLVLYAVLRLNALSGSPAPTGTSLAAAASAVPVLWYRGFQVALLPIDLGLENLVAWLATGGNEMRVVFWLVSAVFVGATAWCAWKRRVLETIGLMWWLAALGPPSLTLATGGYWPGLSRWVYVALPGLLLALAPLVARVPRQRWTYVAAGVVALFLAFETQRAMAPWENDETLLENMIEDYPEDYYAYLMLARYYLGEADVAGAITVLRRGREACGPATKLTCLEATTLARIGRCDESADAFSAGVNCQVLAGVDAWETLGHCRVSTGDLRRARRAFERCRATRPSCAEALSRLPPPQPAGE